MFPLAIDLSTHATLLVGGGPAAAKRLAMVEAAGGTCPRIFAPDAEPAFASLAGDRLLRRLPVESDIVGARIVFVADLPVETARPIAAMARAAGAFVNVEDVLDLCDFHVPAIVRRGDLVLAVSTGGRSPGLARLLKRHLEERFPAEWAGWVDELAEARFAWRAEGRTPGEISGLTEELIRGRGWLD